MVNSEQRQWLLTSSRLGLKPLYTRAKLDGGVEFTPPVPDANAGKNDFQKMLEKKRIENVIPTAEIKYLFQQNICNWRLFYEAQFGVEIFIEFYESMPSSPVSSYVL